MSDTATDTSEPFGLATAPSRRAAFLRALRDRAGVLRDAWTLLTRVAKHIPFAEDVAAAYFCVMDRQTPRHVKLILLAALAYFALPFDAVADFLPVVGFADDAAVIAAALSRVRGAMKPEHYEQAREALDRMGMDGPEARAETKGVVIDA